MLTRLDSVLLLLLLLQLLGWLLLNLMLLMLVLLRHLLRISREIGVWDGLLPRHCC